MTVSNFNWTDKQTVKWFIMLPTGHEGPYSLNALNQRLNQNKIAREVKVWAEGLNSPVSLKELLERSQEVPLSDELPPPLPEIPTEEEPEEALPDLPVEDENEEEGEELSPANPVSRRSPLLKLAFMLGPVILLFLTYQWLQNQQQFSIRRHTKMSPTAQKKIERSFQFAGWNQEIFFKEFISPDMTHIWLVTAGYQHCKIEAQFTSVAGSLLTMSNEAVSFSSRGELQNHVTEFSKFEFTAGSKIIPGLYEMEVSATECHWGSLKAKLGNLFSSPQKSYKAQMKVVLYHAGAEEFNKLLDQLNQRKLALQKKAQEQKDLFWEDLQQKLYTLQAMSFQIEQLFIDFLDKDPKTYTQRLPVLVSQYTSKYGSFFTNFVVANENYFQEILKTDLRILALRKNYEEMIRLTAKKVGFESMKIIERLQAAKKPIRKDLNLVKQNLIKNFKVLKEEINQKLIEVTEDRSN